MVSHINGIEGVPQGMVAAKVTLTDENGKEHIGEIRAGEQTALFAHESLAGPPIPQLTSMGVPFYNYKAWCVESNQSMTVDRQPFMTQSIAVLNYITLSDEMSQGEKAGHIRVIFAEWVHDFAFTQGRRKHRGLGDR